MPNATPPLHEEVFTYGSYRGVFPSGGNNYEKLKSVLDALYAKGDRAVLVENVDYKYGGSPPNYKLLPRFMAPMPSFQGRATSGWGPNETVIIIGVGPTINGVDLAQQQALATVGAGGKGFDRLVNTFLGTVTAIGLGAVAGEVVGGAVTAGEGTAAAGAAEAGTSTAVTAGATESVAVAGEALASSTTSAGISAGGAAAAAGGTAAVAQSAAGGATQSAAQSAVNTATASSNSVIGSVAGTVRDLQQTVTSVMQPITDAVHSVTSLVNQVNDGLIKPIITPINQIVTSYETLRKQLDRNLDDGIRGLARIPQDIANALTSVDASLQRSLSMMGATFTETLIKGYNESAPRVGSEGFKKLEEVLFSGSGEFARRLKEGSEIKFTDGRDVERFEASMNEIASWFENAPGWLGELGRIIVSAFRMIAYLTALNKPFMDAVEDRVNREHPTLELGIADTVNAYHRGVISKETAMLELRTLGYSEERADAMIRIAERLPSLTDLIVWRQRNLIDDNLLKMMAGALGFHSDTATLAYYAAFSPPALNDLIEATDRTALLESNIYPSLIRAQVPERILSGAAELGISHEAAQFAWQNHFAILPPPVAVLAYFRNFINLDQVRALLRAGGLPDDIHQTYIDLQRPRLPARSLPAYVRAGVISDGLAHDLLLEEGYRPEDVERLIEYSKRTEGADDKASADALHGLTVATVLGLFDEGALERSRAETLLQHAGIGTDAAKLTLDLREIKARRDESRAQRDLIVKAAKTGSLTEDEATNELNRLELSTTEVTRAMLDIARAFEASDKTPSESQLTKLHKASIITDSEYLSMLQRIGYSRYWSERLFRLNTLPTESANEEPAQ